MNRLELNDEVTTDRETPAAGSLRDDATFPRIQHMPEGIEVVEHDVGRATAQWILQVRCQCGRRWFELEEIEMARCPRCETLVQIDVEGSPRPNR